MLHHQQIQQLQMHRLEKVGVAAGIYKMASALGGAFGVALSGAVYAIVSNMTNIYTGAMIALWLNAGMGIYHSLSFCYLCLNKTTLNYDN